MTQSQNLAVKWLTIEDCHIKHGHDYPSLSQFPNLQAIKLRAGRYDAMRKTIQDVLPMSTNELFSKEDLDKLLAVDYDERIVNFRKTRLEHYEMKVHDDATGRGMQVILDDGCTI